MFDPNTFDQHSQLALMLDIIATPGVAGFDYETNFARTYDRQAATMQISHEDGRQAFLWVWPFQDIARQVAAALENAKCELAAHFAIFETEMTMKLGAVVPFKCTYIAARVLRGVVPGNGIDPVFSLKALMESELGIEMSKDARASDWREPPDEVMLEYALLDSDYARDLWILYKYELNEDPDQLRGFDIVNNSLPAIAECNLNGLMFDADAHNEMCVAKMDELESYLLALDVACDGKIQNHGSPKQVSQWLAEQLSFEEGCTAFRASALYGQAALTSPWKMTASKQLSLDKSYVESQLGDIEAGWPDIGLYLRTRAMYQKVKKLLEAFGRPLHDKIDPDGHLRGSLIPHGARTSRQSCRDPNLQQMPNEPYMRRLFTRTKEGRVIVQADYEQVELVVGCVICDDENMKEVFRNRRDIHSATAANISKIDYADFDKANPAHNKLRTQGKPVTFAALYGAKASTIALNSGLPMVEAEALLDNWLEAYPAIRTYREEEPGRAMAAGFSQLVSGQKIRTRKDSRGPQLINLRVQGGAASVMYLALTYVFDALRVMGIDAKLALCVHDEILLDCAETDAVEAGHILEDAMTQAIYDLFPEVRDIKRGKAAEAAIVTDWSRKDDLDCKLATIEAEAAA